MSILSFSFGRKMRSGSNPLFLKPSSTVHLAKPFRLNKREGKEGTLTSFTTNQALRLTFISLALTPSTLGDSPADTLLKSRVTKFPLLRPNTSFCGNFSSIGKAGPPNTYETFIV